MTSSPLLTAPPEAPQLLPEAVWLVARAAHEARADAAIESWRERHARGEKDPVLDFLFEYYAFRPTRLRRWSPGVGVALEGAAAQGYRGEKGFEVADGLAFLSRAAFPDKRVRGVTWILDLLRSTAARSPNFGCYGLHEWAMVYRAAEVRHAQVPLRMEPDALAAFVESRTVCCSHWDAFRFFTPEARPLNRLQPRHDSMHELEQPGCVHTNMDLYRWSFKLWPWIGSDLILDAFELACATRVLDMRASPYDLRDQGIEPIPIETEEGREHYRVAQRAITARAQPLRGRLIAAYEALESWLGAAEAAAG